MTARVKATKAESLSFTTRPAEAPADEKRLPLFEVDGVEYSTLERMPPGKAIEMLAVTHAIPSPTDQGCYLIREMAGPRALEALLGSDISEEQWQAVIDKVWPRAFGRLEGISSGN